MPSLRRARIQAAAFTRHNDVPLALQALALTGAVMGSYSIKVVRSKTAIVPVNASLLPRTEEESERCKRTVYVTNIDLGVEVRLCGPDARRAVLTACELAKQPAEVSGFFETLCGPVAQLHLTKLDSQDTQVAFVEFSTAHSADRALSCGGARLKVRARATAGDIGASAACLWAAAAAHRRPRLVSRVGPASHLVTAVQALPIRVSPSKTPLQPSRPTFALSGSGVRGGRRRTRSAYGDDGDPTFVASV